MENMKQKSVIGNKGRAQVIDFPRKPACNFLEQTEEKIFFAFKRGTTERQLAQQYGVPRAEIEAIIRERLTGREAAA